MNIQRLSVWLEANLKQLFCLVCVAVVGCGVADKLKDAIDAPAAQTNACATGMVPDAGGGAVAGAGGGGAGGASCRPLATCESLSCGVQGRSCTEATADKDAFCGACTSGENIATGSCVGADPCGALGCQQRHQVCDQTGTPHCADACTAGYTWEAGLKACRPLKSCAEIVCPATQTCMPATDSTDARCDNSRCAAGQGWDSVTAQCRPCAQDFAPRCDSAGETGAVLVLDSKDGATCGCETQPGYYIGAQGGAAVPCDADKDGWVSDSAQSSLEGNNAIVRVNSRCDVRRVASVILTNEASGSLVAEDFSAQFGDQNLGIPPGLPLYESARDDGAPSNAGIPSYNGDALDPRTVNALTKYCGAADYNDNGVSDVSEWSESGVMLGASRPSKLLALYYAKYTKFSYFAELHNGWFEAALGTTPASYRVAERLRTASGSQGVSVTYPTSFTTGLDVAEVTQCLRHIDTQFKWSSSFGAAPKLDSPNSKGGDFAVFGDTSWTGMTHHSQFKCVQLEAADKYAASSVDSETSPEIVFVQDAQIHRRSPQGQDKVVPWYLNDCHPTTNVSDSPGGEPRTALNTFVCTNPATAPDPGAVVWAAVGFENGKQTSPYVDFINPGNYKRGCRNECAELPAGTPGPNGCPQCRPGKLGRATPVVAAPNAGQSCDRCGGVWQCDGTCGKQEPADLGKPCSQCGGVTQCNGTCSFPDPAGLNQACSSCGGITQCNGTCSAPDPENLGKACGAAGCNGTYQCGGCSTPASAGAACGHCGGTYACDGSSCSRPDPADYGSVQETSQVRGSGFVAGGSTGSSPSIDQNDPTFFDGPCPTGWVREGDPWTTRDNNKGHCEAQWDAPFDNRTCTVRVHMGATFWEGNVDCRVHINLRRVCD